MPTDIFCTGLYAGRDRSALAADVEPYTPGVVLWSDGAQKQRFFYLPPGSQIDTTDLDAWTFPAGTKAWKEFVVDGTLIETRLFWKRDDGTWDSGTYRWNDNGTQAVLNTAPAGIHLASGYEIPTQKDCNKCHHGGSDALLGVEALTLALPSAQGDTLEKLVADDKLSYPPLHTTVQLPNDDTGNAADAMGWLHVNCGMTCHSARGIGEETNLVLRLRASELWPNGPDGETPDIAARSTDIWNATFLKDPTTASVAQHFPGAHRITPGNHEQSLLWLVAHRRGQYQMPPLVSHAIDEDGTAQLATWIDAIPADTPP